MRGQTLRQLSDAINYAHVFSVNAFAFDGSLLKALAFRLAYSTRSRDDGIRASMKGFLVPNVESSAVRAEVAQMVERAPEKRKAVGSLPTLGTIWKDSMHICFESFLLLEYKATLLAHLCFTIDECRENVH